MKTTKQLGYIAAAGLALCLTQSALAWPDAGWNGGGGDGRWTTAANWSSGLVPGITTGDTNTSIQIGNYQVTIAAGETITLDNAPETYPTLYGPEWGGVLNIYGSLYCTWYMAPVGAVNNPSVINLYGNGLYSAEGIALGENWWWNGGPGVTLNINDSAQVNINWLHWGGKINMFGGILNITNGVTADTVDAVSDATRNLNLRAGGMVVLPFTNSLGEDFSVTISDWMARGILLVYGVPGDTAHIVIDTNNATWPNRTVLTTSATGPTINAIRIEVPRTGLHVGGRELSQVYADFPSATNVNITGSGDFPATYHSTDTGVATIDAAGLVQAVGVGSASIWATVGSLSNSVAVTVAVYTNNTPTLVHRYSFSEANGEYYAADSIGGPEWLATIMTAGGSFDGAGQLVLDGLDGYLQFPAGILTNMDAVTIETWATFGTIPNWAVLFTFGDTSGTIGHHYISFQPHTGATTAQSGIKSTYEQNPWFTPVLDNYTNLHIVAVFHPEIGVCSVYTNGTLAAINSAISISMAEAMATQCPYNYIGKSQYSADPFLACMVDEFRIYRGPLSAGYIKANAVLGPDSLIGSNTSVSLTATLEGGNLVLTWPSDSALVNLVSTPALGAGASWTSVGTGSLVIEGGNYKWTLPATDAARFFRLQN